MAGTAVRMDLKQKSNLQKENETSVGSSSNEHSPIVYGQIGFHLPSTDDSFDDGDNDGRTTVAAPTGAYYNVSNFAAMNAARVKVSEVFNLTSDGTFDHFAWKEENLDSPSTRQTLPKVKGERGKTKSVVAPTKPLNSRLTSSIGQLQSSSLGFCTTKSHQRVKVAIAFSATKEISKEIFKSADDSNNTRSEGLEQFTVRHVCFSISMLLLLIL